MKSNNTTSTDHCCRICDKHFTLKRNVTKHLQVVHKLQINKLDVNNGLYCPLDCKPRFITSKYALLRGHISSHHGMPIECEEQTFSSLKEFSSWKDCVEKQSVSSYITQTAPKRLSLGQKKTYYVCHRSGPARQASTGKRTVKFQGTCKVGTHCPSTLELTEDDGKFHVKFYKTHAGHEPELVHIKLTREERTYLAAKIINGESFTQILDEVQGELGDAETLGRRHLLSRKDLYNIKFELGRKNRARSEMTLANQVTGSSEEVKRKLNLLLELIEHVEMDEGTYSALQQVLDSSIAFAIQKGIETNTVGIREASPEVFQREGNDSVDAQIVNARCDPVQNNVSGLRNAVSSWAESPLANTVGFTDTNDPHLDVTRREPKPKMDDIGDKPRPPRRLLPKTDPTRDVHLDVVQCTGEGEATAIRGPQTGELYLDFIRCGDDDSVTPTNVGKVNVFRCATRRKKSTQENIITLRKRMRGNESSIRVYAVNDTLEATDFDQVYGINV